MTLELIRWEDSTYFNSGWDDLPEGMPDPECLTTCTSVGWVKGEDDHAVYLVPHFHETSPGKYRGIGDMLIPKRCIVSRQVLVAQP